MPVFAACGLGITLAGTAMACLAPMFPQASSRLETLAGLLVVVGLVMIGVRLSVAFT